MKTGLRAIILWWAALRLIRRDQPNIIAVGGGIAKTSTKNTVGAVLSKKFKGEVLVGYGNLNTYLGVPLSILGIDIDFHHQDGKLVWLSIVPSAIWRAFTRKLPKYLVLEYGTDHPGDIAAIVEKLSPDIAILTTVAPAHVENYGSLEKVAEDEGALLAAVKTDGTVFLNKKDPYYQHHLRRLVTKNVVSVDLPNEDLAEGYARAVAKHFGLTDADTDDALSSVQWPKHRFSQEQIGEFLVLDDSYNANPASMEAALRKLEKLPGRKVAILGTMKELGNTERVFHRHVGNFAHEIADFIIGVGELADDYKPDIHFPTSEAAAAAVFSYLRKGDSILVKGSRSVQMEKIVDKLRHAVS